MLAATTTPAFNVKRTVTVTLAKPRRRHGSGSTRNFVATISGGGAGWHGCLHGQQRHLSGGGWLWSGSRGDRLRKLHIHEHSGHFRLTLRAEYSGDATHFAATSTNDAALWSAHIRSFR